MSNAAFLRPDENGNWGQISSANTVYSATVANGGTTSDSIFMNGYLIGGIEVPSTWDGGNITIQVATSSGGTFYDAYDSTGNIVTVTVGTSRYIGITGSFLQAVASAPYIRLKSASAVGADRTLNIAVKG
jgi:hypothetical protein